MTGQEMTINIEAVRVPQLRETYGDLSDLGRSIEADGLRHPITVWTDGTLISGARRLRTHFLLAGQSANFATDYRRIRAVFVDTIEDAAKRMLIDNNDEVAARPMKPSEMCRLWEVLRQLDEPAALKRADAARRRGVELRRATLAGARKPGRSRSRGAAEEYVLATVAQPFGMSESTASRLWTVYAMANSLTVAPERRERARLALEAIDAGLSSISANYTALVAKRATPLPRPAQAAPPVEVVPAARQLAAWSRSLPQLEGLTAGLVELGPPNPDLTWDQIGPVVAQLSTVRRSLEKIIKNMKKENAPS